ncbi:flavin reductase (DIM6/NTAB) family NADH-FMN oxidoreductase RutF [Actinomadura hallensis]|uniref:Flavin reductase (DIM6/NTAB) family NADH-FMN oxidoreductase RutF n=1 Tax=Actinomadura hallensis TaxID=337895 RepID=A0A543IMY5_9ACTN|nr:flavin reductase family protein [Actinomadura hallensis]TQM71921.1 flavin reductase (DIM6/NTAB) family NADH-FMN oxidoreductase RutF [Actinomadura hallensis]HLV76167.1 flavin reductase family protein [Vulgatibacteraceae bacterium]
MTSGAPMLELDLRRVYGAFPTGLSVVAGLVSGEPAGIAASSFVAVSLDPPLVSVCVGHASTTWPRLRTLPRIGISVLGAHQEAAGRRIGARRPDRFATVPWRATPGGSVLIAGAPAWYECSVERQIPAGDHDIVVFRVHDLDVAPDVPPLVFHGGGFHRLCPPAHDP